MDRAYPPTEHVKSRTWINTLEERLSRYKKSISDPAKFWAEIAKEDFYWESLWTNDAEVRHFNYDVRKGKIETKWFEGGRTNLCYNCLDRHIKAGKGNQVAYYWEGNDVGEEKKLTYDELFTQVCKFSNLLRKYGLGVGSKVTVFLPMVLALPVILLGTARIGAVLNVVFAGFSAQALSCRLVNCQSSFIVTADATFRGAKPIPLKTLVDDAIALASKENLEVSRVLVVERRNRECPMKAGRDFWWDDEMATASADSEIVWMNAEDPLFLLYTSGSTGQPKGVVHTTGGYMVYAGTSHKYIFDYHEGDVYWCTADVGWVTGHSYVIFGPLLNNATSVMFEGVPTYPHNGRYWEICQKYKVNIFYSAPTAIRSLMKFGEEPVLKYDLSSLRVLGSVGEPINVEAWLWFHKVVGKENCSIVDTYWQSETGGIVITPLPGSTPLKPGAATLPFFGAEPAIINEQGEELTGPCTGFLVMKAPHPGICRTVYGDHKRYEDIYFGIYPGFYFTGDGARRDEDGYYWITGRVDDVLNVSGHRLGTAEIENAINSHPDVIESAVVGYPHPIKGVGIYAYIIVREGVQMTDALKKAINDTVRKIIGPLAQPDILHVAPGLPKTRSGKIMRRILRKIANDEADQLGDLSTLADPAVVERLVATKAN